MILAPGEVDVRVRDMAGAAVRPRVWGLGAPELHDAYWRGLGVQVVRRGSEAELDPAADMYLLVEPDQLLLFDLDALLERIAWRSAGATRLRITAQDGGEYGEQVELDEAGRVRAVLRRYEARSSAAWRVLLVRKGRLAAIWASAPSRRDAWRAIRKRARYDTDAVRADGTCAGEGDALAEHRLVGELVRCWRDPDRVLEGVERVRDLGGNDEVFAVAGMALGERDALVGPAWVGLTPDPQGRTSHEAAPRVLVGPAWAADEPADATSDGTASDAMPLPMTMASPVRARAIRDIEPEDRFRQPPAVRSERPLYEASKRLFDLGACVVGMLLLAPIFLLVSLAVIVDNGWPVLYGQRRQGRGGAEFTCWKFRTMVRNADAIKPQLDNLSTGPQFFMRNDPRVTRVGAVLRKTHLDELPQLINVLLGDMSLVGPRPSPEKENRINPAWREIRLSVRPGVTGLWQLRRTRRPDLDFQEWIRYDTEYVERRSFAFDLSILFGTLWHIAVGKSSKLDLPEDDGGGESGDAGETSSADATEDGVDAVKRS